ncbi:hypothetical protein H4R20_005864 [Coemansia guatemalensis]|uniref:Uncharacterized protein n=1 Tax=Coemansia guatemalensis TaxID=2761395 RepID=A0A9W8HQX0_9FUNG|nr:hypothetical protein H4R20_005864 [Coemansia guatemalensis]
MTSEFTFIAYQRLAPFFAAYGSDFKLSAKGIYYDVKVQPIKHLRGYYELARILEEGGQRSFQCFPLRTGWIPAHIMLDTMIARRAILELPGNPRGGFRNTWAQIVNLGSKPFYQRNGFAFRGTIQTNGVTASIVKITSTYTRGKKRRSASAANDDDDAAIPIINELTREQLKEIEESSVYIDPGRRQLIHAMGHGSTSEVPQLFRTTMAERMSQMHLHEYNEIRDNLKTHEVRDAELDLSTVNCKTLVPAAYDSYIRKRAEHWETLSNFYSDTMTTAPSEDGQRRREKWHQQRQQKWGQRNERHEEQATCQLRNQEKQCNCRAWQQLLQEEWRKQLPMKHRHGEAYCEKLQNQEAAHRNQQQEHGHDREQSRECLVHEPADVQQCTHQETQRRQVEEEHQLREQQTQELEDLYQQQQKELEELKYNQSKKCQTELLNAPATAEESAGESAEAAARSLATAAPAVSSGSVPPAAESALPEDVQKRRGIGQDKRNQKEANRKRKLTDAQHTELEEKRLGKIQSMKQQRCEQKNRRQHGQQDIQNQHIQCQEERTQGLLPRHHPWSTWPLHRKLQESAYINHKRMDAKVACDLRQKFGLDPTLILGNWSAGMVRYHAPIPGKGLRRMLIKHGFRVFHIDEFKTSTWCPYCGEGTLEKFLDVENPRPHRRAKMPVITSHAVLCCNNDNCVGRPVDTMTGNSVKRIINRDLAACMNFKNIVDGLRNNGSVPERFVRQQRAANVPAVTSNSNGREAPDDEPPARLWTILK